MENKNIGNNEKEKIVFNTYSRDNNQENKSIQINNEEENVNLGISYGKISDPEAYINNEKNRINAYNLCSLPGADDFLYLEQRYDIPAGRHSGICTSPGN